MNIDDLNSFFKKLNKKYNQYDEWYIRQTSDYYIISNDWIGDFYFKVYTYLSNNTLYTSVEFQYANDDYIESEKAREIFEEVKQMCEIFAEE